MSDCSREAFPPKKQPETCATCDNHTPSNGWCKRHGYEVDSQFTTCICHTKYSGTIEQRCAQLEQVALRLHGLMLAVDLGEMPIATAIYLGEKSLQDCGVSLDD